MKCSNEKLGTVKPGKERRGKAFLSFERLKELPCTKIHVRMKYEYEISVVDDDDVCILEEGRSSTVD